MFSKRFFLCINVYFAEKYLKKKFCSQSCSGKFNSKNSKLFSLKCQEKYYLKPQRCQVCEEIIVYEKRINKFCSRSCAVTQNNKARRKFSICIYCDNKFYTKHYKIAKYCNKICQSRYRRKIRIDEIIKSGVLYKKPGEARVAKTYLLEIRGHKCEVCNITKWCGRPAPLIMDHIDGNYMNNRLDNLRLVCGNCDMQLPTYKSKNKGKGRHSRRERYRDNKSY